MFKSVTLLVLSASLAYLVVGLPPVPVLQQAVDHQQAVVDHQPAALEPVQDVVMVGDDQKHAQDGQKSAWLPLEPQLFNQSRLLVQVGTAGTAVAAPQCRPAECSAHCRSVCRGRCARWQCWHEICSYHCA